ncbi:MAG: shikimate dehydrogenase [Fibrobacterales bacterium]
MTISGKTKIVGILGYPVEHSFSPNMHNTGFAELGLDFCYIPLETHPDNLENAVAGLRAMNFVGANVTIPHKQNVIQYLDEISEISELMQSVNTIYKKDGKLCGTTTDPYGALENLRRSGVEMTDQKVTLLGTGGAASAIACAFALEYPGITLTIAGINATAGGDIVEKINTKTECKALYIDSSKYSEIAREQKLLINATPLGMHPNEDASAVSADYIYPGQIVYDIVYNPRETKLLKDAAAKGAKTVQGLGMLAYQGVKSFEIWTGVAEGPAETFVKVLDNL